MIKVNHFMSDELGKMVGDELGSELWQKGMMNEIRRYPNEIPCENGEIPSVIIPKCGGFEKVEWGFTAGMSCLVPKAPGEIEIRNALHFPASATLALLSLLYDEGATNAKSISLTLHIPENAGKFKDYLSRALQKLPNVHAATVSLPAVKDSINTGSDQFTGGSSVASCVGAQVVDVGRIQFSAKLQSGSFKVGDIAAITDGDLNVIARYCPILDLSNAAGQDISATEGCGTTFGAYIAVWFPPNSEFDSLYIVNEGNPVFTPARMPEKPTLNSKNSNVVPNKIPASSADFVIENGVLKKYTGKGGNVVIPDGVTSIGEDAFNRYRRSGFITPDGVCVDGVVVVDKLKELSSVTIPDSVMSIGRRAFYEYESLTDINIPGSVTSIGKEAFCGCTSLKNIILPNSINNIDDYTFHKCKNLTSITIPNSVTRIGDGAFECCESLTNITIPDSVKSIGDSAFSLCKSLTSITIHDSVESISDFAFYGCGSLTSVIIPNSVTSIGKWAFNRCGSLTRITISDSVENIGDAAFDGCKNLTSITIPKRLESAFKDYKSIKKINYTNYTDNTDSIGNVVPNKVPASSDDFVIENGVLKKYAGNGGCVIIPDGVTSIGDSAFKDCEGLTGVTIPNSVTSIDDWAFLGCTNLKSIIIPDSVISIGYLAFKECTSLTDVTIPDSVKSIGDGAFLECEALADQNGFVIIRNVLYSYFGEDSNVVIPNSVTGISCSAFSRCESMTSITIPSSVKNIGESAFMDCEGLADQNGFVIIRGVLYGYFGEASSVVIPSGVTGIGCGAFSCCESLTSVTIPDSVTSIGADAFCSCTSLTSITIPSSVKSIGESAFEGCEKLTTVFIPKGVTNIGDMAFKDCESLADQKGFVIIRGVLYSYFGEDSSVIIPNGVTGISCWAFFCCESPTSITIPDSVESISDYAFYGCGSLTSVIIPNSVTSIGKWAFNRCGSLTSITIPDSVATIGDGAFDDCESLTSVTIPKRLEGAFKNCKSIKKINYADGSTSVLAPARMPEKPDLSPKSSKAASSQSSVSPDDFVIENGVLKKYTGNGGCVIIPDSVTCIGDRAFFGCINLTDVTIPNNVTSIGAYAFLGCLKMTSITIPDGLATIGGGAFFGCKSLTNITIPNSVTAIGNNAFDGCEKLTSITIPKRLESAFKDCRSIKKINYTDDANRTGEDGGIVPGGAKSGKPKKAGSESKKQSYIARIEHEQTGGWHQYTVILQPGLNYSWDAIIANADSMADADLAPIMNIQLQTAWGVSKDLIKAYKNSGYRFSETNELTEDEGNMLCIGGISDALGCPTMITWFNQIYAFGITTEKERSDEQIRRYAETIVAKRFGESAVQADAPDEEENSSAGSTDSIGNYRIKKVTQCRTEAGENGMFPQGDSEDDAMAMMDLLMGIRKYRCIYRYEIELDSAPLKWKDCLRAATNMMYLDMLPEHFTYGCGKLEAQPEKDITNSFFNIADCDLRLVPELKNENDFVAVRGSSLNLDVDIKVYFHNGKKLITLYAPIADKEQIQEYAETKLCRVLAVEISGKDTKKERAPASAADTGKAVPSKIPVSSDDFVIENGVLKKYTGAGGNVIIPNGVTRIDDRAFWGCIDLKSITIPDSVTSIGYGAFYGCIFLTRVTIPSSVINIGEEAFYNCLSLADSKGFIIVRGILYGYLGNDTNVAIPKNVKVISSSAFEEREKLIRVNIPNSVTRIGFWAFKSCTSLTSITIPDSVTDISFSAFDGCENLTSVTIPKRLEAEFEDYKFIKEIKYSDDTGNSFWKKLFKK